MTIRSLPWWHEGVDGFRAEVTSRPLVPVQPVTDAVRPLDLGAGQRSSRRAARQLGARERHRRWDLAARLLADSARHLDTARSAVDLGDLTGAYQLAYDALRNAATALLVVQGLRSTSRGGHIAIQDAVLAQVGGVGSSFRAFSRIRCSRNSFEYPDSDVAGPDGEDVEDAIRVAHDALRGPGLSSDPVSSSRGLRHQDGRHMVRRLPLRSRRLESISGRAGRGPTGRSRPSCRASGGRRPWARSCGRGRKARVRRCRRRPR